MKIMKKTYIHPEMEVVEVNMSQTLLAGSALGDGVLNDFADESSVGLAPGMDMDDIFQDGQDDIFF